ncbi:hypothetical protein H6F96_15425 [Microcoleus sp. FACHB-53]|nr:hypothetical protein [Microcoleus sp. FACHB-53]
MGTRPNKYQKQATLGIVGLFLIASPILLKLPSQFHTFNSTTLLETEAAQQKAEIEASEDLERIKIEQKKQTADKLKQTGLLPSGDKLKIRDYYDNTKWNPNPNTTGFLKDEIVFVYDSAGICIGKIQARKWLWKHFYQNICNNVPVK